MQYNFSALKQKIKETEEWLTKEFSGIRTGRATPLLLDGVSVEVYGSHMPIAQLANISIEGARSLRVSPWDKSTIKDVEKALIKADLGVGVAVDDEGIRISFPELTSERRVQLIKIAKERMEDARITLRGEREKVWTDIQAKEKEGEMSEDDKFRAKEEMQKIIDEGNRNLEAHFEKKEKEIAS
jgi:ribosome recycling factor